MSTNKLSILTTQEWQKLYPEANFAKKVGADTHGITSIFHYYMNIRDDASVIDYISKCKTVERLTLPDQKILSLTPLAIACMQGREEVACALLDKLIEWRERSIIDETLFQQHIDTPDRYGWTPLHHASLTSEDIYQRLCELGANSKAKTRAGATCCDLRNYVRLEEHDVNTKSAVRLQVEDGSLLAISEISQEHLKELTGLECYRENPYFPPHALKRLWTTTPNPNDTSADPSSIRKFLAYEQTPTQLIIRKSPLLEATGTAAYELVAAQEIPAGGIIGQYGASYCSTPKVNAGTISERFLDDVDSYAFEGTSAARIGNAIRFANCGFPNAVAKSITIRGVTRHVLEAIEPIKGGDAIVWDYGLLQACGWTKQSPFREAKMRDYYRVGADALLRDHHIKGERVRNHTASSADLLSFNSATAHLFFLINNPNTMLFLSLKGDMSIRDMQELMLNAHYAQMYGSVAWIAYALADMIDEFDEAIKVYSTDEQAFIKASVLRQIGSVNLDAILKYIKMVTDHVPNSIDEGFLLNTAEWLAGYKAIDDPEPPLSTEYVANATVSYLKKMMAKMDQSEASLLASQYHKHDHYIKDGKQHTEFYRLLLLVIEHLEREYGAIIIQKAKLQAKKS